MEILTNNHKYDNMNESASSAANSFLVTDIKQGVKNPNRANIFINNKYSFSLDIAQIVDFKLKKGQSLTKEQLEEYQKASTFGKLYQRTLEWVLTRPHSIRETKDYLNRKKARNYFAKNVSSSSDHKPGRAPSSVSEEEPYGFGEYETNDIISRLIEKGYLDDQKFAEYYVENRFVKKGISKKRLQLELMKKGIDKQIIDQVLENTARNDEDEIKKIIAKKRTRYDDDKLIQYLVRQGFDYALSRTLVLETDSQN